jgi:hypothetical protein
VEAGVIDEAREIRETPRTTTNRARTILGFRWERRRLMLPPDRRLLPWMGIYVSLKEGCPHSEFRDNKK